MYSVSSSRRTEGAPRLHRRRKQDIGVHGAGRQSRVPLLQGHLQVRPWSNCRYHWRNMDWHLHPNWRHGTAGAHQAGLYQGDQSLSQCCQGQSIGSESSACDTGWGRSWAQRLNAQKCTLLYVLRVNRWVSEHLRTRTRSTPYTFSLCFSSPKNTCSPPPSLSKVAKIAQFDKEMGEVMGV